MADILIVLPVTPVRRWMADALKTQGHGVAEAATLSDALHLLTFGSFASVLAWLPRDDLPELAAGLNEMYPQRPGLGILCWDALLPAYSSWFDKRTDRVILLPTTSASLLEAVADLRRLGSASASLRPGQSAPFAAPLHARVRSRWPARPHRRGAARQRRGSGSALVGAAAGCNTKAD